MQRRARVVRKQTSLQCPRSEYVHTHAGRELIPMGRFRSWVRTSTPKGRRERIQCRGEFDVHWQRS